MSEPIHAAKAWKSNAEMIADVARLGYLNGHVMDCTYGLGVFWKVFTPEKLTAHDLFTLDGVDFRNLPHPDGTFDTSVIDGPYKLNGTSSEPDVRYGVDTYDGWKGRHRLIREGITECARVTVPRGYVLVKCQAQVCGGAIRWQDREFAAHGESVGLTLVDRFDLLGKGRKQKERTKRPKRCQRCDRVRKWAATETFNVWECRVCGWLETGPPSVQEHAYGRPSTLLVFKKSA